MAKRCFNNRPLTFEFFFFVRSLDDNKTLIASSGTGEKVYGRGKGWGLMSGVGLSKTEPQSCPLDEHPKLRPPK